MPQSHYRQTGTPLARRDGGLFQAIVPEDVIDRWIAHDEALIDVIADPTDCVPGAA